MPEARRHYSDSWQQARPPTAGTSTVQSQRLMLPDGHRSESKPRLHSVLLATNSRNLWSRCMVNRSIKLILKGFVWMILASSLGCGYGLKRVNVQRVEGTLECFESIDARLLRTNRFTIVFGSGSVFLQIRGDDGNLVSQSVVDEYDYGRWWRAESTNGQDSAWIRAKNDKSNNIVPLGFQDELILMPLFWTSNNITKNLTPAVDSLRDSQIFSVIREEIIVNRMGGPYIKETRNNGIIVSREISSSYSDKPEDIDFKMLLFEVKYLTNNSANNYLIPSHILLNDYRLGKVFPPTRYRLFIEAFNEINLYPQSLYPEVGGSKYMLTDYRNGFISQRDQSVWPARYTSEFKMATRSRLFITIFLTCFAFVSAAFIVLSVKNKNKNE